MSRAVKPEPIIDDDDTDVEDAADTTPSMMPAPTHIHPASQAGWYASARLQPALFTPLALLWLISEMADGDGKVKVQLLARESGQEICHAMIRMLMLLGHIATDGVTVTIRRLPTKATA